MGLSATASEDTGQYRLSRMRFVGLSFPSTNTEWVLGCQPTWARFCE